MRHAVYLALGENAADGGKSRCKNGEPAARTDLMRVRTRKAFCLLGCLKPRGGRYEAVERDQKPERTGL